MKKATLLSGVFSAFFFLSGIILKIYHLPGAGPALVLSTALFVLAYSPLLLIDRNNFATGTSQKFINIAGALAMILVAISFMFKVMHWPGAGIAVVAGNVVLLVMIPIMFIHALKEDDAVKKLNFYHEAILMVFLSGFSLFIWLIISR